MLLKKNIKVGKIKFFLFFAVLSLLLIISLPVIAKDELEGNFTDIKVLDKISSKNTLLKLKNN